MKLNHECVRDLLLYLEDNLLFTSRLCANNLEIAPYESADIIYAAARLSEAKFIETSQTTYSLDTMPTIHIQSLTWDGHKFLDNIRDDNVWNSTKSVIAQFSSVSIGVIDNVSNKIISKLIEKHF
jgi:hypothetical protein